MWKIESAGPEAVGLNDDGVIAQKSIHEVQRALEEEGCLEFADC